MLLKNKVCVGCGCQLQDSDPKKIGFVKSLEQDYCQRCFRLTNYGDVTSFKQENLNRTALDIIQRYKNEALFVLIVDCFETLILNKEPLMDSLKELPLVCIVNKIDLLPKNVTEDKINEVYTKKLFELKKQYPLIKDFLLTQKNDSGFKDVFNEIIGEYKYSKIVFIGKSNAGKSTILNKLLETNKLTTSIYPGTTVDEVLIPYDKYTFIDTPGIDDEDNLLTYLSLDKLKKYNAYKTIKPLIFQVYEAQSFYMSGLFRLDILPKKRASVIFESNRDDIHRTNYNNKETYEERNAKYFEFKLDPKVNNLFNIMRKRTFIIKGFGLIRVVGECKIVISINDRIKIYESEVDF